MTPAAGPAGGAPPESPSIFRPAALQHLASGDRLDQALRVTSLRAWLALLALTGVLVAAVAWGVLGTIPVEATGNGLLIGPYGLRRLTAPADGDVTTVRRAGDTVRAGEPVAGIRAPAGAESQLLAERDSLVVETYVSPGETLRAGSPVATVEPLAGDLQAAVFVPVGRAKRIQPGMPVRLSPTVASAEVYGVLVGRVGAVSAFPASTLRLEALLGDATLARQWSSGPPVYEVTVQLPRDPRTASGYTWTSGGGPPFRLTSGTVVSAAVVLAEQRPLALLLSGPQS